ncbi:MAG: hypothetical protein IT348_05080 [Candidatus Eisenbacteria bacterium]|nr:hypothetical protein [Candidatus Eisenbacteria bacterium]
MLASLRALAPAVLLLASLAGHMASGALMAHVAFEHSVPAAEEVRADHAHEPADVHHAEHHADHHADHHAEHDAHAEADHSSEQPGHDPVHSHDLSLTSAAPARIVGASLELPLVAMAVPQPAGISDERIPRLLHPLAHRIHPPLPKRHSILLI